ncbi:MAG: TatD family deoxyribonuclease [Calditrichaeota bacterium]|nr:MAG: TatD family deoxyribonuclease [Calditrichota bacterium]
MNHTLIDSHCHLQWNKFDLDRDEVIECAVESGVSAILTLATDLRTSYSVVELAEKYEIVFAAIGIHPTDAKNARPADLDEILKLTAHPKVVAIGETGMDFYWEKESTEAQEYYFREQLRLAAETDLPVVIHNREAGAATLKILNTLPVGTVRGVFHCFAEDAEFAKKVLNLGFYISFTGNITYKKSGLPEISQAVPLDRLLLETDSPFLAPVPKRGKRNEPAFVRFIAEKHAEIRGVDVSKIADVTTANANSLFRFAR